MATEARPQRVPRKPWNSIGRLQASSGSSTGGMSDSTAAATYRSATNRHEVRGPVPVKPPPPQDEDAMAEAFAFPVVTGEESPMWFQAELRARFISIEEKIKKLAVLDVLETKLDEVLAITKQYAERAPADSAPQAPPSPRSPKQRTTFTALAGALRSAARRPTLSLPPPPSRIAEAGDGFSHGDSTGNATGDDASEESLPERITARSFVAAGESPAARACKLPPLPDREGKRVDDMHTEYERRNSARRFVEVWQFFEDEESSIFARMYAKLIFPFIVCTVILSLLQALDDVMTKSTSAVQLLEACIEGLFVIELLARFAVMPTRVFFLDVYNLIDIVSVLPLVLRVAMGLSPFADDGTCNIACSLLVGAVPVIRLLKLLRRFQNFQLLLRAFVLAFEALPVLLFIWAIVGLAASAALWVAEPRDNLPTFGTAMWLSVVSMTTLGYGDYYPNSTMGRIIVSLLVVCSTLYTAIPLGIIGSAFSEVWHNRFRILLTQRTRKRLQQAGYEARDIPYLFQIFDANHDNSLDIEEFKTMVEFMKVGFRGRRVVELFDLFDDDGSGTIDDREFVKALFPESFHDLYDGAHRQSEQVCSNCGNVNMAEDKFCKQCGTKRSAEEECLKLEADSEG
mmetsp:Transcript_84732/g.244954  ORF Transcript_84732/g.244954 Transcript_84732/m.244954 type:complete len:628 (+) Transcript_84732:128-2011(+)